MKIICSANLRNCSLKTYLLDTKKTMNSHDDIDSLNRFFAKAQLNIIKTL